MASAELRQELTCSICMNIYTEPVTLRCGHNFCRGCIDRVLDTQDGDGLYSCPECRVTFRKWPPLERNITLCNVVENVLSTHQYQEEITGICCTYCVDSPTPAVKSCLLCEASLCDNHLRVHSKGPDHVLIDPSTSMETRKCSVHMKILEYYCTEDVACICVSCSLVGEHRGLRVETLDEAAEKKKKKLKHVVQKLIIKRKEIDERLQSLKKCWRKAQEGASGEAEIVTALCTNIRRPVDDLEKRILSEASSQEEQVSLSLSDVIHQLELKKDELSRKTRHIEELCNMTDPLTVLQDPDTRDLYDPEEEGGDEAIGGHDEGDEEAREHDKTHDVDVITGMIHAGSCDIVTYLQTISPEKQKEMRPQPPSAQSVNNCMQVMDSEKGGIYGEGPTDILLDVNTAANNLLISDDLKIATRTEIRQNRPKTAERFLYNQVMSRRGFTSGRHYWDVEISGSGRWRVGMCYPSIDRSRDQSYIGYNTKSWCLHRSLGYNNQYSLIVIHDRKQLPLPHQISSDKFRICLDYEAGQLSFYALCDPIRHLHTFTATFTEPLHAVLYVYEGSIKISGGPERNH